MKDFFFDYKPPEQLLPLSYFENNLFNRYQIEFEKEPIALETLKKQILSENQSVLVILNTIDDTKELFKRLKDKLNTWAHVHEVYLSDDELHTYIDKMKNIIDELWENPIEIDGFSPLSREEIYER